MKLGLVIDPLYELDGTSSMACAVVTLLLIRALGTPLALDPLAASVVVIADSSI